MGLSAVHSRALWGLRTTPVTVEVHLANGLPSFTLVGLADMEVREARERVRCAIQNAGLEFPSNKRITVNLAPADLPKDSGRFDLPIALGILAASGQLDAARLAPFEFAGELSLSGELRAVRGALAMSLGAHSDTHTRAWVLPPGSAEEAALVPHAQVYRAQHLRDVVAQFLPEGHGDAAQPPTEGWQPLHAPDLSALTPASALDWADVKGQNGPKRALEIAAAGGHSVLLVGPPGSGKSMLAQRFASLLPPLNLAQALDSAAIASLVGRFALAQWGCRPFRAPHHTTTAVALVGGGSPPRPGEISLAHHGVLFLDELPEFARHALEALREPLENGRITISRAAHQAEFPAEFQLIAAMNPCPCGYLGSTTQSCRCTPEHVSRYQGRLSGPLMDRIDLHVSVQAQAPDVLLTSAGGECSAQVRERCVAARARAVARQGCANQALHAAQLDALRVQDDARHLLHSAAARWGWSGRSLHRVLKIARSIADLAAHDAVHSVDVAEAMQYRRVLHADTRPAQ